MKKVVWFLVVFVVFATLIAVALNQKDNSSYHSSGYGYSNNSRYSNDYNTNSEYRNTVNDVADIYGVSNKEVDDVIQRMAKWADNN